MTIDDTADAVAFRGHVRDTLRSGDVARHRHAYLTTHDESALRPLYGALGRAELLAVCWPEEYGGLGKPRAYAGIVLEELARAQIPDTLYVISMLTVGEILLVGASDQLKSQVLPRMARGDLFASLLYTEPESGSDLTTLSTVAISHGSGFRITGTKLWSINTRFTDVALCAAATRKADDDSDSISLFLVELDSPQINIDVIPSIAAQQFHSVRLDGVNVAPHHLVGDEGQGRALMLATLSLERNGLDAAIRAEQWYKHVRAHPSIRDLVLDDAEQSARLEAKCRAARLLAWEAFSASGTAADPAFIAKSKWYCSEVATAVAEWGIRLAPFNDVVLDAYRESPGLTIAGGTSEVMLQLIGSGLTIQSHRRVGGDDFVERLRAGLQRTFPGGPFEVEPEEAHQQLQRLGLYGLEVSDEGAGLALGTSSGIALCEELGLRMMRDRYRATALLADMLARDAASSGRALLAQVSAGTLTAGIGTGSGTLRVAEGRSDPMISGKWWVADPLDGAAAVIITAQRNSQEVLVAVPWPAPGASTVRTHDGQVTELTFRSARLAPIVVSPLRRDQAWTREEAVIAARVRHAAYLLGMGRCAHDLAVARASARIQFGKPIVQFQSIGFRLAAQAAELDAARLLIERAATVTDRGDADRAHASAQALAYVCEAVLRICRESVHVHGAYGMSTSAPVSRVYTAVAVEAGRWGSARALWKEASGLSSDQD